MGNAIRVRMLRSFIGTAAGLVLLTLVVALPVAAHMATADSPQDRGWIWLATLTAAGWLLCILLVLGCAWQLLTAVHRSRIFDPTSFSWVNVMVAALATATGISAVAVIGALASSLGPISVPIAGGLVLVLSGGLLSLVVVLRDLLRQATTLKLEMDAVV